MIINKDLEDITQSHGLKMIKFSKNIYFLLIININHSHFVYFHLIIYIQLTLVIHSL